MRTKLGVAAAAVLASGCLLAMSSTSWSANTLAHCGPSPIPVGNSIRYNFSCRFDVATIDFQNYLAPPTGDPQWPFQFRFQNDQGFVCGPNNPPDEVIHCTRTAGPIPAGQPISGTVTTPRSPCTQPNGQAAREGQGILIDAYSGPPPGAMVGAVLTDCGNTGATTTKKCKKKGHKKKHCGRRKRHK